MIIGVRLAVAGRKYETGQRNDAAGPEYGRFTGLKITPIDAGRKTKSKSGSCGRHRILQLNGADGESGTDKKSITALKNNG
jgi:hypothetical protein